MPTMFYRNKGPSRPWPVDRFFHFYADFTKDRMWNDQFTTSVAGVSDVHPDDILTPNHLTGGWSSISTDAVVRGVSGLQTVPTATRLTRMPFNLAALDYTWRYDNAGQSSTSLPNDGIFSPVRIGSGGFNWQTARSSRFQVTIGSKITVKALYKAGTSGRFRVFLREEGTNSGDRGYSGPIGNLTPFNQTISANTTNLKNTYLGDGLWEFSATYNSLVNAIDYQLRVGPDSAVVGEDVIVYAAEVQNLDYYTPWIAGSLNTSKTITGNVQNIALPTPAQTGICGFWHGDVKGFAPNIKSVLLGFRGSENLHDLTEAINETTATLPTGVHTIMFATAPGYTRTQLVGAANSPAQAAGFDAGVTHMTLGGNGFNANNNVHALHKVIGMRYGPVDDDIFTRLTAATTTSLL